MKTLDGTLYRRALDCSGPQSAHTRAVPRAGGQSPLWVHSRQGRAASKPGHARYAAESGSKFRAASQLMHLVKVARA